MSNEPTDSRARLMMALSGLEFLIANAPIKPSEFSYSDSDAPVSVRLHFRAADDVRDFADVYGAAVQDVPGENDTEAYVDTEARGTGEGVSFLAWARTYPPPLSQSPAGLLGTYLQKTQPDVEHVDTVSEGSLRVRVRPRSMDCWRWWLGRFNVAPGAVELDGQDVTAIGTHGDITIHLTGLGVEQLIDTPPVDVTVQPTPAGLAAHLVTTLAAASESAHAVITPAASNGMA
ncbi:hypothetical protein [Streptomyces sp. NBC_01262]|uniref:hypothetical protein n=1 Tax=Streptomyces sp. NBC_01262 TaxID=2903803 RepID=UPI002E330FBD|nr:hypothetical protein [Streptomyces sp. NBC_01262]